MAGAARGARSGAVLVLPPEGSLWNLLGSQTFPSLGLRPHNRRRHMGQHKPVGWLLSPAEATGSQGNC